MEAVLALVGVGPPPLLTKGDDLVHAHPGQHPLVGLRTNPATLLAVLTEAHVHRTADAMERARQQEAS
jgi:hypothetical protein